MHLLFIEFLNGNVGFRIPPTVNHQLKELTDFIPQGRNTTLLRDNTQTSLASDRHNPKTPS